MAPKKKIKIYYYALLREQRGCSQESIETDAKIVRDLYADLLSKRKFTLPENLLKVALNDHFVKWDAQLRDGDTVVFIPPVAGG